MSMQPRATGGTNFGLGRRADPASRAEAVLTVRAFMAGWGNHACATSALCWQTSSSGKHDSLHDKCPLDAACRGSMLRRVTGAVSGK